VLFAAHGLPRFGREEIVNFLTLHRDAYKFLHDQTVRLMNNGLTAAEIAEELRLPRALSRQWFNRGYYGTVSHNSKAIYQRYLGWFDANPAHLNPLPPEPLAKKYVSAIGGAETVLTQAQAAVAGGELRWAATLLNHLVFAAPENANARLLLAEVYTRLGQAAEAGTWRNIYLTGALELTEGVADLPLLAGLQLDTLRAMTTAMLLDVLATRINPVAASARTFSINLLLTDRNERHLLQIRNGVLVHEQEVQEEAAGLTLRLPRPAFLLALFTKSPAAALTESGQAELIGDAGLFDALTVLIEAPAENFNIVTP